MEVVVALVCNQGHRIGYDIPEDGANGGIRPCKYSACTGFVVFKQIALDKPKP